MEENCEIVDDATIYFLKMFLDSEIVMVKDLTQIRQMFGEVTSNSVNKIRTVSMF